MHLTLDSISTQHLVAILDTESTHNKAPKWEKNGTA